MIDREIRDMFAAGTNPVFEFERRKLPWVKDTSSLTKYRKTVWIAVALFALAVWLVLTTSNYNDTDFQDNLLLVAICASVLVAILIDLYSTLTLANYLHHQIRAGDWELLG